MTDEAIQAAVQAQYDAALANPQIVAPVDIGGGIMVRTDVYDGPAGAGFQVVCGLGPDVYWCMQHGPETAREIPFATAKAQLAQPNPAAAALAWLGDN